MVTLLCEFFRAVSFEPGGRPHYEAVPALFVPGGLLIRAVGDSPEVMTVEAFVRSRRAAFDAGAVTRFHEAEVQGRSEEFGHVGQRWSRYWKRTADAEVHGWISTQFVRTPSGWLITSMAWDDEPVTG